MKKFLNQRKKPYDEEEIDWEEEYYEEDDGGGYYAGDGADESGPYDADGEEYYAEGEEPEAYCADGEEPGEYYGDGEEPDAYYGDGEEPGEYYAEGEEPDAYYEDAEGYGGEYYADGGEEYAVFEDDMYYEDEYDGEEGAPQRRPGAARAGRRPAQGGFIERLWNTVLHMNTMDRVVMTTGVLVLVLALVTGTVYISANMLDKQVASFDAIGSQLEGINIIGESGLSAVADAELARINAANAVDEEENGAGGEYDENEYVKEVKVSLNMVSIEKDLKVKFVNDRTDRLIANVPFKIEVTKPGGDTETWSDDDMDGIIYKQGIKSGKYTVRIQPLEGEKYEDYIISTAGEKVEVKDKIEYKKVDVKDEIKDESEVNASKEDTGKKDTEVESQLNDTVAWVDSTQNIAYTPVQKSAVKDPSQAFVGTRFYRLAGENVFLSGTTVAVGGTVTLTPQKSEGDWTLTGGTWASSDDALATVSQDGTVSGLQDGTVTITYSWTGTAVDTASSSGDSGSATVPVSGNATCEVTVEPAPVVDGVTGVTVSPGTLALDVSKKETSTGTLTAAVTVTGAASKEVTWESSNTKVAKVAVDASGKVTVTAVGAGTAAITATSKADNTKKGSCAVTVTGVLPTVLTLDKTAVTVIQDNSYKLVATTTPAGAAVTWTSDKPEIATVAADGTVTGVKEGTAVVTATTVNGLTQKCTVTVVKLASLDKTTVTVAVGGEATVTVRPADDGKGKVAAFSGDDKKVTVSVKDKVVTLKGIQAGSAAITIVYTSAATGKVYSQDCTVTIVDGSGKLKDKDGNALYVKNTDGTYTEALTGDYYKYDTFYLKTVKYTGWQTIDGKVYFYDANGKYVTGEQVIQGAKYNFASDGSLVTGGGTFGIDVSKWNGTIDWNAVKNSGVSYVIIRCGYRGSSAGALVEDPKFRANIKGATAAGLKVGVYFFSQAINKSEAVEEASTVLELIKNYKISYPVFLDVESSGGRADKIDSATRTEVIKSFCETIQGAGYTAGVYANKTWLNKKMDVTQLTKYKIWLAQYAAAPTYNTTKYDMWQYKSTGRVSGISGNVDLNISYLGY